MNNDIKEILDLLNYNKEAILNRVCCIEDFISREQTLKLLDYTTNLQQKCEELECDLEELTFSYNQLEKELREKKEQCNNLIEHINPYHYYGISESDFH